MSFCVTFTGLETGDLMCDSWESPYSAGISWGNCEVSTTVGGIFWLWVASETYDLLELLLFLEDHEATLMELGMIDERLDC